MTKGPVFTEYKSQLDLQTPTFHQFLQAYLLLQLVESYSKKLVNSGNIFCCQNSVHLNAQLCTPAHILLAAVQEKYILRPQKPEQTDKSQQKKLCKTERDKMCHPNMQGMNSETDTVLCKAITFHTK